MKFYPQDWRADEKLRNCSLGARGLWLEMLCLMHRSERYGTLLINGDPPTLEQLAMQVGATPHEVAEMLQDLEKAGVFSRTGGNAIYSRRMKRDEKKSKNAQRNGSKGGNPRLRPSQEKQTRNPPPVKRGDNEPDNGRDKTQIPEARSQIPEYINNQQSDTTAVRGSAGCSVGGSAEDLAYDLADVAGMPLATPGAITAATGIVRQWLSDGIDVEEIGKRVILQVIGSSDEPTSSLRRFDRAIRHEHARRAAPGPEEQIRAFETAAERMKRVGREEDAAEFLMKADRLRQRVA